MKPKLNLKNIEDALKGLQKNAEVINHKIPLRREPLTDKEIENIISGYEYIDYLSDSGIDFFSHYDINPAIELNNRVIWGKEREMPSKISDYIKKIQDQKERYFEHNDFFHNFLEKRSGKNPIKTASLLYIHLLSQEKPFTEGMPWTAMLIMDYILLKNKNPVFVPTADNAREFYHFSFIFEGMKKDSLFYPVWCSLMLPLFSTYIKNNLDRKYLLE